MQKKHLISQLSAHTPTIIGSDSYSSFSVLIPLMEIDGELHIVFEVRSENLRRQPGEICFPGGKIDQTDESPRFAAIRETSEELLIEKNKIDAVYPMNYLVSPFGMIVYPFVGFLQIDELPEPNASEVAEVFTVPLSYFLSTKPTVHKIEFTPQPEAGFPYHLLPQGEAYRFRKRYYEEYFYEYNGYTIWGLTAKIAAEFIDIIST